jgi:hypothetical protein
MVGADPSDAGQILINIVIVNRHVSDPVDAELQRSGRTFGKHWPLSGTPGDVPTVVKVAWKFGQFSQPNMPISVIVNGAHDSIASF